MATRLDERHELAIPFEPVSVLLRRYAERHPDKPALVDLDQDDKAITWGRLHDEANRIAHWLSGLGVQKGDKVALLAEENLEKLILWIGIWRLGAIVCPLNVEMNKTHVREILGNIGPKLTLWHEDLDGPAMTGGVPGEVMRFGRWPVAAAPDEVFAAIAGVAAATEVDASYGAGDLSAIFCTSGTTSKPKCVVYDHMAYWLSGLSTLDMLGLTADDRTLEYRSFGWNSAQILSFMPWLQTGLTLHIARRFSHSRFFDWIRRHGITFAAGVPTVVNMLLNEPLGITADDVPTLRLMTCSTAPLSPEQWERFEKMYGLTLLQLYGMSEAGWICGNRHYRRRMGTVGPPAKHQEFVIVDGDGRPCPPGVEGEVSVGGPQTCLGTISPEGVFERTRETRMKTGDLAVMDVDGFVRVTGRTKDLIIRGGVNIAPLEIDNVLLKNPKVLEAASVGVPDEIYGEEIVAYVVAKPGEALTAADVAAHCATLLPAYKVPKAVRLVADIPKSDRGKIKRDALKAIWLAENAAG
jgi:acyl-coenzyme A synthetase/AMP-(fatty) acid ligase